MYFVRFHPEVTSCLLSRGKTKYATLGMRLWCKYIRNYLLVYQLTSQFLPYLRNYEEFEGEISDLQLEKYGLSFEAKKYTTSGWARGDENVIGIRTFRSAYTLTLTWTRLRCQQTPSYVQKIIQGRISCPGKKIGVNLATGLPYANVEIVNFQSPSNSPSFYSSVWHGKDIVCKFQVIKAVTWHILKYWVKVVSRFSF